REHEPQRREPPRSEHRHGSRHRRDRCRGHVRASRRSFGLKYPYDASTSKFVSNTTTALTNTSVWITGKSLELIALSANVPIPGTPTTVPITPPPPPMRVPCSRPPAPAETAAFFNACFPTTRSGDAPFARAVRTYAAPNTSTNDPRIWRASSAAGLIASAMHG